MDYSIEELNINNVDSYAKINALTWKQSYKNIVNDDYLNLINTEIEINKTIEKLKENINDGSKRYLLKYKDKYVGILRARKTKYDKYKDYGELGALYLLDEVKGLGLGKVLFNRAIKELKLMGYTKMIIGCLSENPSNEFYIHMGCKLIDTNPLILSNNQVVQENLYYFDL